MTVMTERFRALRSTIGWLASATILLPLLTGAALAQEAELLEPERAFALTARALAPDRLEARWEIAPGYYMYRDKFRFELVGSGALLGDPDFPPGKAKVDEFFGEMEIYEGTLNVALPVERRDSGPLEVILRAQGQGCNEPIGVCYPPLTQEVGLLLAAAEPPGAGGPGSAGTQADPSSQSRSALEALLRGAAAEPEFLEPEQAFKINVLGGERSLRAEFDIAEGYYLYQDKLGFQTATPGSALGSVQLPAGKEKVDEFFGETVVYDEDFAVELPIERRDPQSSSLAIEVAYQGCAEQGICYPPMTKSITVALADVVPGALAAPTGAALPPQAAPSAAPERTTIAYMLAAFGTGILLTFTPCVLPMIPILSSIIVGQGSTITRMRGGMLSIAYVLGTALTYAAIGVIAGATGDQLQAYFQNAWIIGLISLLFAGMALSMFGLYEIQMPSFIQSRLQQGTMRLRGGSLGVVFLLGTVSALIVGACVSPLLISVLSVALVKGDPVLGAAIMIAMALGMGVILVAIGFGAGFVLPKAGPWMERVKQVFGVLLLAVAVYLLGSIPEVPVLLLWAGLLIVTAVYLGATQALPDGASGWRFLWKGVGTVMLVWGVLALAGGLAGNRDITDPLPQLTRIGTGGGATAARVGSQPKELFATVGNLSELDRQLLAARDAGRPVVLDYYADWCVDCLRMERGTFQDPVVNRTLREGFVLLQVDVTDPTDAEVRAIKQRFGVFGPPAMLFFDRDGRERSDLRVYGYQDVDEFLSLLSRV